MTFKWLGQTNLARFIDSFVTVTGLWSMPNWTKRLTVCFGLLFTATMITLAFIPHYGCACGEIEKVNGSQLSYLPQTIVEFVIKIFKAIF